ncbi:hypothetical protein G6N76_02125 [Rhizobium daejeonense]|uniref:Uncharacterized protein n=1 Tax=Rhizobium daejeonense TaxID=240521 RepID=A0A6M1S6Y2_9HYPH|nr:hypothetical protein [Rhizobium daejeonense]NGO62456.1 hypothetical protein [Rhizobium daejeonense]
MSSTHPYTADKAALLADYVGRDFLRLARELRRVQEQRSDLFIEVAEEIGLGRRKAFALARVARIFDDLDIDDLRLNKIGWAKLNKVSSRLNEDNAERLLTLAEEHTSHQLDSVLKGELPVDGARVVLLYFTEEDYALLSKRLLEHGAQLSSNGGIAGKEQALMSLIRELGGS